MKRPFGSRVSTLVSTGIKIGLEVYLVQPLATWVLVSTVIYLQNAAKPPAIHSTLQQPPLEGSIAFGPQTTLGCL